MEDTEGVVVVEVAGQRLLARSEKICPKYTGDKKALPEKKYSALSMYTTTSPNLHGEQKRKRGLAGFFFLKKERYMVKIEETKKIN